MKNIIFTITTFFVSLCANIYAQEVGTSEKAMADYYAQAAKLFEAIPQHNPKDIYIGTTFGLGNMPTNAVKRWQISEICDCSGNVIRIDTSDMSGSQLQSKVLATLDVEWQPLNRFSFRLSGSTKQHRLEIGDLVYSENNNRTTLREPLTITNRALQLSGKWFLGKQFYIGGGQSFSYQNAEKALTNDLNTSQPNEATPQYASVFINNEVQKKRVVQPFYFVGFALKMPFQQVIYTEISMQEKAIFAVVQMRIPITKSATTRFKANKNYEKTFEKAQRMDRYLHPEKFPTSDSGGSDGGGGSSGGGCGGY